jgi:hypothetical protein
LTVGRPSYRLEDTVGIDFEEIVWDVDLIYPVQDRVQSWDSQNVVSNLKVL